MEHFDTNHYNTLDIDDAYKKAELRWSEENSPHSFQDFVNRVNQLLIDLQSTNIRYKPTEEQLRILYTRAKRLGIDSSAGTGKTTTILIKQLIEMSILEYTSTEILTITYTEASAKDLEQKFYNIASEFRLDNILRYNTIHSFCLSLLKTFTPEVCTYILTEDKTLTIPTYETYIDEEGDLVSEEIEVEVSINSLLQELLDKYDIPIKPKDFYSHISVISERLVEDEESYKNYNIITDAKLPDYEIFTQIVQEYQSQKRQYGVVDYNDMLILSRDILLNIDEYRNTGNEVADYSRGLYLNYKSIYVDEVQDISPLQVQIIDLLLKANPKASYTVIGDCDQSIYYFRGADVSYIVNFPKTYPNSEYIFLTRNRRSTREIIHLSNELISNNNFRYDKKAREVEGVTKSNPNGLRLITLPQYTPNSIPNTYIYNFITNLTEPNKACILYREHSQLSSLITNLLIDRVPFKTKLSLRSPILPFNSNFVKGLIAIINLFNNTNDEHLVLAFLKSIHTKPQAIQFVMNNIKTNKLLSLLKQIQQPQEAIDLLIEMHSLVKTNAPINKLTPLYLRYRASINQYFTGIPAHIKAYINSKSCSVNDLKWVIGEDESWYIAHSKNGINLLSSHSSKGLEFQKVLVLPISDNTTPKATTIFLLSSEEEISRYIEEERRLLYVTVTRAIEELTILIEEESYFFKNDLKPIFETNGWEVI